MTEQQTGADARAHTAATASSRLSELTLEEKASLCLGSDFWHTAPVPRLGIPAITLSTARTGCAASPTRATSRGLRQPAGDLLSDGVGARVLV